MGTKIVTLIGEAIKDYSYKALTLQQSFSYYDPHSQKLKQAKRMYESYLDKREALEEIMDDIITKYGEEIFGGTP